MDSSEDTIAFLREREEKLGAPIRFRTYCTWYGRLGCEIREYGVFLFTDGKTVIYEDFDRVPTLLGIPLQRKRKEKYEKMEYAFPVSDITGIFRVTKSEAVRSLNAGRDVSKPAGTLARILRRTVTKIVLSDGSVIFLEMIDPADFMKKIKEYQKENRDERIQGI